MPKSKIIKELANSTVDIETSLNRLYLLACDIDDKRLMKWTQNELQGYSYDEDLPEYRLQRSYMFRYSGLTGIYQVKNISLQPDIFPKEKLNKYSEVRINQSVRAIMDASSKNEDMARDLSWLASQIFEMTDGHIQATRVSQIVPASMFQDVLSTIKQKTIQELIEYENRYGNLDGLEIQTDYDPENVAFWNNINDRIKYKTKDLYTQNFFEQAAKTSVIEVETCLRQMYREWRPGVIDPKDAGSIIDLLLRENGAYHYCDVSTQDGKNFCRGFVSLTKGFFEAYRNPLSHNNREMTKREAFELISLSSMIMEVLSHASQNEEQDGLTQSQEAKQNAESKSCEE